MATAMYLNSNPQLGLWVMNQRASLGKYKNKEPLPLGETTTRERFNKLKEIGFDWGTTRGTQVDWEHRFFKDKHGHCNVPQYYEAQPQLGVWAMHQRARLGKYKKKEPLPLGETTTREQINKLDSIEFIWNVLDANWEKMCNNLVA
ncbi:LOW QUALITY PROTEIN: hypothetical protein ACHAWO_006043 [Cyclotella atomus]|uniref:Helicase-associated domain-containing protein n=1 Tax=Cyclotella atomus TaxID=382360 RepID=A0ABD3PXG2_9STRA